MLFVSACVCGLCELPPLYSSYLRSHLFSKLTERGRVPLGSTTARAESETRAARTLGGSFATWSSVGPVHRDRVHRDRRGRYGR